MFKSIKLLAFIPDKKYEYNILDDNFDINPFFDLFKIDTSKDKWNVNGYFLESSLLFSQKYESQYLVLISKNQIIIDKNIFLLNFYKEYP